MVANASSADLQRQMRQVRQDIDSHSEEMVRQARKQLDWRHFIAKHPFVVLGAAAAAGYFLAPRRIYCQCIDEKTIKATVEQAIGRAQSGRSSPKASGLLAGLASMAMGIVVREAVSLASQLVRNFLDPRSEAAGETLTSFNQPSATTMGPQVTTNGEHP